MQRNFHVGNQQFLACNIFQHQQLQQYGGVSALQPMEPMAEPLTHPRFRPGGGICSQAQTLQEKL